MNLYISDPLESHIITIFVTIIEYSKLFKPISKKKTWFDGRSHVSKSENLFKKYLTLTSKATITDKTEIEREFYIDCAAEIFF